MQNRKEVVAVAMSGGVDSSVTAALLKEQGYDVIGITMHLWSSDEADNPQGCCSLAAVEDAKRVAEKIGIPHRVLNMQVEFVRRVVDDFIEEYKRGRTPNPCVRCNELMKFDLLLQEARKLGADKIATGHYARVAFDEERGRWLLKRAVNRAKDQSYALYTMTQDQLSRTLFPLGEVSGKDETRRIAAQLGLVVAEKPDSQEICFVPGNDYREFLRHVAPEAVTPGQVVDSDGKVLGEHQGIAFYTLGQRKGLGVFSATPKYVIEIDRERNRIIVGDDEQLYKHRAVVDNVNLISQPELEGLIVVSAKVRYNMQDLPGRVWPLEDKRVILEFDKPARAITPGQSAVFYQDEIVVGGGTIVEADGRSVDGQQ